MGSKSSPNFMKMLLNKYFVFYNILYKIPEKLILYLPFFFFIVLKFIHPHLVNQRKP